MTERARLRLVVLRVLVISLLLTLGARLWILQVVEGPQYRKAAEDNRVREVVTPPTRGLLVDDAGRVLVRNRTSLVVSVDRSMIDRQRDRGQAVLHRLASIIKMPYDQLERRIQFCSATIRQPCWNGSPYQPVPVAKDVSPEKALVVIEHQDTFPGVSADLQAVRTYPYGSLAAHELGYLAPVSQQDLTKYGKQRGYHENSLVGQAGLEASYDQQLRGQDGVKRLAVNRSGRVTGTVSENAPQGGGSVVLSLDAGVQRTVQDALQHALERARAQGKNPDSASGVVLDAKTGGVIALASLPTYDPSVFTGGISEKDFQALSDPAAGIPLLSRAFQGAAAPGSTFKPLSTTTALSYLGQSPNGTYDCSPSLPVGTQTFHNFEGSSAGPITLHQALVISCDVIFDKFGYDAWLADGGLRQGTNFPPANEYFVKMARAFGLGRATGIDLPGETTGAVVDRARQKKIWEQLKDSYCRRAKSGYSEVKDPAMAARYRQYAAEACVDGYLYIGGAATQFAIGQGQYLSVSPLQLAVAYAAIANGGTVFHPRLGKAVVGPDGKLIERIPPAIAGRLPASAQTLAYIRAALHGVTAEPGGTASGVFGDWPSDHIPVAGKTGTAEVEGQGDTSWFASFAPSNDPQYVVVVSIPKTGQGAQFAAPAVKEIYQGIFGVGRPAELLGGKPPVALPRLNPDGSVSPPGGKARPAPTTPTTPTPGASPAVPGPLGPFGQPGGVQALGPLAPAVTRPPERRGASP